MFTWVVLLSSPAGLDGLANPMHAFLPHRKALSALLPFKYLTKSFSTESYYTVIPKHWQLSWTKSNSRHKSNIHLDQQSGDKDGLKTAKDVADLILLHFIDDLHPFRIWLLGMPRTRFVSVTKKNWSVMTSWSACWQLPNIFHQVALLHHLLCNLMLCSSGLK